MKNTSGHLALLLFHHMYMTVIATPMPRIYTPEQHILQRTLLPQQAFHQLHAVRCIFEVPGPPMSRQDMQEVIIKQLLDALDLFPYGVPVIVLRKAAREQLLFTCFTTLAHAAPGNTQVLSSRAVRTLENLSCPGCTRLKDMWSPVNSALLGLWYSTQCPQVWPGVWMICKPSWPGTSHGPSPSSLISHWLQA